MFKRHLGFGVVGACEVWCVVFCEALPAVLGEVLVIVEDASCRIDAKMNAALVGDIRQGEGTHDVGTDDLNLQPPHAFQCVNPDTSDRRVVGVENCPGWPTC